jgi:hypothetical protein
VLRAAGETETTQENIQNWLELDERDPGFQFSNRGRNCYIDIFYLFSSALPMFLIFHLFLSLSIFFLYFRSDICFINPYYCLIRMSSPQLIRLIMVSSSSGSSCWSLSGVTVYNNFWSACIAPLGTHVSEIRRTRSALRKRNKTKSVTYVCRIFFSAPLFQEDWNQYWIQEHFGMRFIATGTYHCVFIKV